MNNNDWIAGTGSAYAGRAGYRPINPKMVARAAQGSRQTTSSESAREYRRLQLAMVKLSNQVHQLQTDIGSQSKHKARRRRRATQLPAQWKNDPKSTLRRDAILHRWHGPR